MSKEKIMKAAMAAKKEEIKYFFREITNICIERESDIYLSYQMDIQDILLHCYLKKHMNKEQIIDVLVNLGILD